MMALPHPPGSKCHQPAGPLPPGAAQGAAFYQWSLPQKDLFIAGDFQVRKVAAKEGGDAKCLAGS